MRLAIQVFGVLSLKSSVFSLTSWVFLPVALLVAGCSSKLSSLLSESWSENYALAIYGAEASHFEINDGDVATWGTVSPPDRVYTITLPEEREIDRITIYSGNVVGYRILCRDRETGKWKLAGVLGSVKGRQRVDSDRRRLVVPRLDHHISLHFKTDKIKLVVTRAESDGVVMTRTPGKNDKILNHRVEYIGTGRSRRRVDVYDVFMEGPATIREIEVYSHAEEPGIEQ
jgi:hypothetical protein